MQTKEIKVGQKWKTHGGQIAHILEENFTNSTYPYQGRVLEDSHVIAEHESWTSCGTRFYSPFSDTQHDYDLFELIEEGTPEMKPKHLNHEFVLAFINGQDVQGKYDECAAWEDVKVLGQFDYYQFFRIKPSTRMINGFEVPAPLSEEPEDGFVFFYPILTTENMVSSSAYISKHDKKCCFERGLCFTNEEDAFKNARAMVGIDPNGPK